MAITRRKFLVGLGLGGLAAASGMYLYEKLVDEPAEEIRILRLKGLAFFWGSIEHHNPDVFRVFKNNAHLFHHDDYGNPDSIARFADLRLPSPEKQYVRFLLDALLPKDAAFSFDEIRNQKNVITEFQSLYEKIHREAITFRFNPKDQKNMYLVPERLKTTSGDSVPSNVMTICGNADFDNPGMLRDAIREIPSSAFPSGDFRSGPGGFRRREPLAAILG